MFKDYSYLNNICICFRMYTSGINPKIQGLYPKLYFPVSRGTPSLQSLPLWDHTHLWTKNSILDTLVSITLNHVNNLILI